MKKKVVKRGRPVGSTNKAKDTAAVAVETNTSTLALHVLNLSSSMLALREDLRQTINHFSTLFAGSQAIATQMHARFEVIENGLRELKKATDAPDTQAAAQAATTSEVN